MSRSTTTKQSPKPRCQARSRSAKDPASEPEAESPQELQERLLEQIAEGGKLCRETETQLRQHPCPELETIIKLYRVLVLRLSAEAQAMPDRFHMMSALMRPVMEWARLEEKRKLRELAEQKYRDETAVQKAKEQRGADSVLRPETLKRIERELNLF